jgi:hypothetical protein
MSSIYENQSEKGKKNRKKMQKFFRKGSPHPCKGFRLPYKGKAALNKGLTIPS